ncbi:BTAD domain-containing putative transcriptional regulator [Streptomyces lavendulae]|uniref:AfsR/SARP family transcriptional regulator n=1 Tax=Streptomyces lavendulae TaxID=1914 RepID=UPI003809502A
MELQSGSSGRAAYFALLGRFEITCGRATVQLNARRHRLLLAALVCRAKEIVSIEDLIDVVWKEDPPCSVRSQIHICVSAIRAALAEAGIDDAIETHSFGYSLMLKSGQSDIGEFGRLVADARASRGAGDLNEAARKYRDALALWRGPALSGLDSDVLQRKALLLNEERLTVLEECIEIDLMCGRESELVSELAAHVADNPLRERIRGQYMLVLHRVGRRAEALQVYRDGRTRMVEELGLEPSEELRQLEASILNDAPELTARVGGEAVEHSVPRQLPPQVGHFTGRGPQIARLRDALAGSVSPENRHGRAVNLFGQAGVGKSSLAVHAAYELTGDHFPDGQLYYDLHGSQQNPVAPERVLNYFLRTLGVQPSAVPERVDERAAMFRSRVAGRRMLVILDDASDEAQIRPLLPGGQDCAVIITSRMPQTGLPSLQKVHLDMLDVPDAVELLGRVIGDERVRYEPDAAAELARSVGGLPLALSIVGARLAAAPNRTISYMAHRIHDDARRLDELVHGSLAVRTAIAATYHSLGVEQRRLLSLLSLLEIDVIPGWLAAAVLGVSHDRALDLMDELAMCQLVQPVDSGPTDNPGYRFHNLTRLFLRESAEKISYEQRKRVVRRVIGAYLTLVETARGGLYGGDFTVSRGDSPRWVPPAGITDQALSDPLQWMEAQRLVLLAMVRHAAEYDLGEACWDLALNLVPLFESRHYHDDWRESHETALGVAEKTEDVRGEAAVRCSLGSLYVSQYRIDGAVEHLDRALAIFEELHDTRGTALTVRNLALCAHMRGALDQALHEYRRAAGLFLAAGDAIGQAHVWCNTAQIHIAMGSVGTARQQLIDALRISRELGHSRLASQVLYRLGMLHLGQRHMESALTYFREALTIVRSQKDEVGEGYVQRGLGRVHLAQDNRVESVRCFRRALAIADAAGRPHDVALAKCDLAENHLAQNEYTRARDLLEQALPVFEQHGDERSEVRVRSLLAGRS